MSEFICAVSLCLKALKHLLPRDTALQFLGRWYTLRNSPGGIGNQSEWHVFQRCLLAHMGYDTSRLALTGKVCVCMQIQITQVVFSCLMMFVI